MTKNETLEFLAILKVAYPQQLAKVSDIEASAMVELWADAFSRVPKDVMMITLKRIVKNSKYFPSVAEMCEVLDELNREAYGKLTHGKYSSQLGLAEMSHEQKLHEAELEAYEKCADKTKFSRYDFKQKWLAENPFDREQYRNYDDETAKKLEYIRANTADFAVVKYMEHRASGAVDSLLEICQGGQLLLGGSE